MIQGRLINGLAILLGIFAFQAHAKSYPAVPGQYIVKLKPSMRPMSVGALQRILHAQVKETVSKKLNLILVQRPIVENRQAAVESLSQNPLVEYAEPNYIYKVLGGSPTPPNDPQLSKLWGMDNTGAVYDGDMGSITGVAGVDIDAKRAWQVETGSSQVVVAVIDTGVNYNWDDLSDNIYTNEAEAKGKTGVDDDKNGYVDDIHGYDFAANDGDPMDVYGHGTHVSGTIGAEANNNKDVVGVAWHVRILPVRFLGDDGSGTLDNAVKAIEYAIKMKANIMSNSWGGGGFSQALLDSITEAQKAGILFVAAAGNDSNNNDTNPSYPASYQVDNVISVAAIDPTGALASFSNFGAKTVQIAAPGVNILSHTMKGLEAWSGTSMATPHVTGVAALLWSQDMSQSYKTIRQRLLASARPLAGLRGRVATGLVDAYYALTNQVAPLDPNDPYNWKKQSQSGISTAHPYDNKTTKEWKISMPGAHRIAISFSKFQTEGGYDKVDFIDSTGKVVGTLSGDLGTVIGPVINGDSVTIRFSSDDTNTDYGFDVDGIAYQ